RVDREVAARDRDQEVGRRTLELHDYRVVAIGGDVVERYPVAGLGAARGVPIPRVLHIGGGERAAAHGRDVLPLHTLCETEGVRQPVGRDFPRFSEVGLDIDLQALRFWTGDVADDAVVGRAPGRDRAAGRGLGRVHRSE